MTDRWGGNWHNWLPQRKANNNESGDDLNEMMPCEDAITTKECEKQKTLGKCDKIPVQMKCQKTCNLCGK